MIYQNQFISDIRIISYQISESYHIKYQNHIIVNIRIKTYHISELYHIKYENHIISNIRIKHIIYQNHIIWNIRTNSYQKSESYHIKYQNHVILNINIIIVRSLPWLCSANLRILDVPLPQSPHRESRNHPPGHRSSAAAMWPGGNFQPPKAGPQPDHHDITSNYSESYR